VAKNRDVFLAHIMHASSASRDTDSAIEDVKRTCLAGLSPRDPGADFVESVRISPQHVVLLFRAPYALWSAVREYDSVVAGALRGAKVTASVEWVRDRKTALDNLEFDGRRWAYGVAWIDRNSPNIVHQLLTRWMLPVGSVDYFIGHTWALRADVGVLEKVFAAAQRADIHCGAFGEFEDGHRIASVGGRGSEILMGSSLSNLTFETSSMHSIFESSAELIQYAYSFLDEEPGWHALFVRSLRPPLDRVRSEAASAHRYSEPAWLPSLPELARDHTNGVFDWQILGPGHTARLPDIATARLLRGGRVVVKSPDVTTGAALASLRVGDRRGREVAQARRRGESVVPGLDDEEHTGPIPG
jgi:hypothetical protein